MTKGKFGIYLWFYAVLAFLLVFLGQTLLCGLLLGFVIAAERNEWLSRQVIQAFSLSLAVSVVTGVLDIIQRFLSSILSGILYVSGHIQHRVQCDRQHYLDSGSGSRDHCHYQGCQRTGSRTSRSEHAGKQSVWNC